MRRSAGRLRNRGILPTERPGPKAQLGLEPRSPPEFDLVGQVGLEPTYLLIMSRGHSPILLLTLEMAVSAGTTGFEPVSTTTQTRGLVN